MIEAYVLIASALTLGVLIGIILTTLIARGAGDRDLSHGAVRYWALSPERTRKVPPSFAVRGGEQ
jgi:hypothetical protein